MKLYNENYPAPNPRKARIYLAEKGLSVELVPVPMRDRAHKAPDFMKKNTLGQVPVLELDDGRFISGVTCDLPLFEALHPQKPLFGATPYDQAIVEMWTPPRRVSAVGANEPSLA